MAIKPLVPVLGGDVRIYEKGGMKANKKSDGCFFQDLKV